MHEKYKQFWLEKDKEEIIEAYGACIHNGEVLLARIDKAIEELKILSNLYDDNYTISDKTKDIIAILKGE